MKSPMDGGSFQLGFANISLRDWFAGMAMNAIISGDLFGGQDSIRGNENLTNGETVSIWAYRWADCMMEARNETDGGI